MPTRDDSGGIDGERSDEPTGDRTVRELLLAKIDEHCRLLELELQQVTDACEQLEPERARSCRNAITMASVMVDEIKLRAHAPLGEEER
jgi:hypothetical protein